ncbi:hypothetical protein [Hymenobacter sp. BT559]|uniref:hypothetical protein n=1 Tax=Hymenobacter sp. BT559 TaxID=2795729 RepID=UPI001A2992DB|nr:hypothetical protein [Hymenobacter sp. BT559]MBJ6145756.1 hypothetical protein [Hymenobacter sp. BT559]
MFATEQTHAAMSLPTLTLTSSIKEAAKPGVFIGRINEISGIFAQGSSREEVYDDLVRNTAIMLPSKRAEALELLKKQNQVPSTVQSEGKIHFTHKVQELELA